MAAQPQLFRNIIFFTPGLEHEGLRRRYGSWGMSLDADAGPSTTPPTKSKRRVLLTGLFDPDPDPSGVGLAPATAVTATATYAAAAASSKRKKYKKSGKTLSEAAEKKLKPAPVNPLDPSSVGRGGPPATINAAGAVTAPRARMFPLDLVLRIPPHPPPRTRQEPATETTAVVGDGRKGQGGEIDRLLVPILSLARAVRCTSVVGGLEQEAACAPGTERRSLPEATREGEGEQEGEEEEWPMVALRLPWLDACVFAGRVLWEEDRYGGWEVRQFRLSEDAPLTPHDRLDSIDTRPPDVVGMGPSVSVHGDEPAGLWTRKRERAEENEEALPPRRHRYSGGSSGDAADALPCGEESPLPIGPIPPPTVAPIPGPSCTTRSVASARLTAPDPAPDLANDLTDERPRDLPDWATLQAAGLKKKTDLAAIHEFLTISHSAPWGEFKGKGELIDWFAVRVKYSDVKNLLRDTKLNVCETFEPRLRAFAKTSRRGVSIGKRDGKAERTVP